MVNIRELSPGEMIMRHKSLFVLDRERDANLDRAFAECAKAQRVYNLAKAMFEGGSDSLAKAASDDLELAKADVAGLQATHGTTAASELVTHTLQRIAAVMRDYVARTEQNKEDRRRSRRINEAWSNGQLSGPWLDPTKH